MKRDRDFQTAIDSLARKYQYVLVDRVTEIDHEKRMVKAIKCASNTEPYYVGHFPDNPTMPGVLLLMAFSQVGSMLYDEDEKVVMTRFEKVRFISPVQPGEKLKITVQEIERTEEQSVLECTGEIEDKVCVKGRLCLSHKPI